MVVWESIGWFSASLPVSRRLPSLRLFASPSPRASCVSKKKRTVITKKSMSNFVARVANWLANEIVVKKLSQSQGFQRMAAKSVRNIDNVQKVVEKQSQKIAETKSGFGQEASNWFKVLKEEAKKDFEKTITK